MTARQYGGLIELFPPIQEPCEAPLQAKKRVRVPYPEDLQRHAHMLIPADKLRRREMSLRQQIAVHDKTIMKPRDARQRIHDIRAAVHKRSLNETFAKSIQELNFKPQDVDFDFAESKSDRTEHVFKDDGTIATMSPISAMHSLLSEDSDTDIVTER